MRDWAKGNQAGRSDPEARLDVIENNARSADLANCFSAAVGPDRPRRRRTRSQRGAPPDRRGEWALAQSRLDGREHLGVRVANRGMAEFQRCHAPIPARATPPASPSRPPSSLGRRGRSDCGPGRCSRRSGVRGRRPRYDATRPARSARPSRVTTGSCRPAWGTRQERRLSARPGR